MILDPNSFLACLDPVEFAQHHLGITPDAMQRRVLDPAPRRGILNCCRQWGKSTLTAVKAVHNALYAPGSLTLVVSPTERQSGEFVRKASHFVSKLGIRPRGDGDNATSLLFPNGSRIVGLPGTEATIRGRLASAHRRGFARPRRTLQSRPPHARRRRRFPVAHEHAERQTRILL